MGARARGTADASQFLFGRLWRVSVQQNLRRSVGADEQETCRFPAPGQQCNQIDRGGIASMQILKHQHEGTLQRQHFDRLGHLTQHSDTWGSTCTSQPAQRSS
jgi:hypothetical protein